jgi:hypothetical protein
MPAGARLGDGKRRIDMKVDGREGPPDEAREDGVDSSAAEVEADEDEVEAHGGWGGVGKPDS